MVVPEPYIYSTVYIQNHSTGQAGTAFLVSRRVGKESRKVFLVSNKHVLLPAPLKNIPEEPKEAKATILINKLEQEKIRAINMQILLRDEGGVSYVKGHPNANVDVAAIDVTKYISKERELIPEYKLGFIEENRFATREMMKQSFLSLGDRLLVLGYPLNLIEGGTSIPVGRDGIIASRPDLDFKGLPIILIDSTIVRGSSGSPVFTTILPYRWKTQTEIEQLKISQSFLLGVASHTVSDWEMEIKKTVVFGQPPQTVSVLAGANFGIVFRAETISETLDEFGQKLWKAETAETVSAPMPAEDQKSSKD